MNAWASAIQSKKLSGERIANLEKMSECPALTQWQKCQQQQDLCGKATKVAGNEARNMAVNVPWAMQSDTNLWHPSNSRDVGNSKDPLSFNSQQGPPLSGNSRECSLCSYSICKWLYFEELLSCSDTCVSRDKLHYSFYVSCRNWYNNLNPKSLNSTLLFSRQGAWFIIPLYLLCELS